MNSWILKKVLIIGASGFVGSYIFKELIKDKRIETVGTYCNSFHKDLIQIDYLNNYFPKNIIKLKPDVIIWAAGEKNLAETEINFDNTKNLISSPILSYVNNPELISKVKF